MALGEAWNWPWSGLDSVTMIVVLALVVVAIVVLAVLFVVLVGVALLLSLFASAFIRERTVHVFRYRKRRRLNLCILLVVYGILLVLLWDGVRRFALAFIFLVGYPSVSGLWVSLRETKKWFRRRSIPSGGCELG